MQKARSHSDESKLLPLVSAWFQVLLTPLFGVLFTFPSQYWYTIGLSGVFSLTGWCRQIQTRRLRPRPTQDTTILHHNTLTGLSPSMVSLSRNFCFDDVFMYGPTTPWHESTKVWAFPLSLATTYGITIVFSSSGYLDVSVPRVFFPLTRNSRSSI